MNDFNLRLYSKKSKEYVQLKSIFYDNDKLDNIIIVDPTIASYNINISCNDLGKNYILERCTGMTDKNGVWIYENDILKYDNPFLKNDVVKYQYDDLMSMIGFTLVEPYSEVIGNIHQNKDLLGE